MLPDGWKRKKDDESGMYYYVNRMLRRTTWTRPELNEEKKRLRRKVDARVSSLEKLRRDGFRWVPGKDNVRPTLETREKKLKWLDSVLSKYRGRRDFVLNDIFLCETKKDEKGLMYVPEASLARVGKKRKLYPNMFPYDLPSGTLHYIMWYTWLRPKDCEITDDIGKALGGDVDFIWYENPKMTIPEIFHVQVFVVRATTTSL